MTEETFENRRINYFKRLGVILTPRRFKDWEGRVLYMMESRTDGQPVIVIHGGGDDASEWGTLLSLLSKNHRWIIVDRPGHGLSYKLDYRGVAFRRAAAEYVCDVLDAVGLRRAMILANSMGGYFALCFALAFPERVERLVLIGAPAGVDRWLPPFLRLLAFPGINRLVFAMMKNPTPDAVRQKVFGPLLVAKPERVPNDYLELEIASWQLPGASRGWRTLLETAVTLRGFRRRYYIRDDVGGLAVPTTFVWGDRDAFAPPASGAELVSRMPSARLVTITEAGHLPWFDEPIQSARAVEEALAPIESPKSRWNSHATNMRTNADA